MCVFVCVSENYFSTKIAIDMRFFANVQKFTQFGSYLFFKSIRAAVRAQLPGKRAVVEKKGRKFVIFGGFSAKLGVLMLWKQL